MTEFHVSNARSTLLGTYSQREVAIRAADEFASRGQTGVRVVQIITQRKPIYAADLRLVSNTSARVANRTQAATQEER